MIVSNFGTTIRIDADSVSRQGRAARGGDEPEERRLGERHGEIVSANSADTDSAGGRLTLDEISGESQTGTSTAGLPEPEENGTVPGA